MFMIQIPNKRLGTHWGDNLKLKRATFKYIESELYSYKDTLKEIERLRDEILYGSAEIDENVGGGRSTIPSKPTEQIATRLLTHKTLRNLEEVANAITDVYNLVSDDHRKVIELKYFKNPKLTWDDVAYQLKMHRNTAFKLRREVIHMIANKLGLR